MFNELRHGQKVFSDIFAWNGGYIHSFEADRVHHTAALAAVPGNYYRTIGIQPLPGRFIRESDVALDSGQSDPLQSSAIECGAAGMGAEQTLLARRFAWEPGS